MLMICGQISLSREVNIGLENITASSAREAVYESKLQTLCNVRMAWPGIINNVGWYVNYSHQ